jgi:hypothetical protein
MATYLQRNNSCILPKCIRIEKLIPENTEGLGGEQPP